ncbi:MAG TPA: zinc-ribbon domain-containing protein [Verrucomicrobiae bacterium]|nr:zinc-ribbon domain-containing protein [Verrucomicrobiae bacterium]
MSYVSSQTTSCPSCREEIESAARRCPHCGRPLGERGFFFYAFWVGLSVIVLGLIACIFYTGFLVVNRML